MKNIKMTCIVFVALTFSGTASSGWLDFLNKSDDAAETVQNTTSTVKNVSNTVESGSAVAETAQAGLVDSLVKQLGITSEQAQGGSGALFEMAKKDDKATEAEIQVQEICDTIGIPIEYITSYLEGQGIVSISLD